MANKAVSFIICTAAAAAFTGCGPAYQFDKAQKLEKDGFHVEAGFKYQNLCARYPSSAVCPEALYRVGRIYQKKLKLYDHAAGYFRKLAEYYPSSKPWAELAKTGIFDCPDYFPLSGGSFWIEGDSETQGRNMRAEWNCQKVSTGTYTVSKRFFAGTSRVADVKRYFRKKNMQLREYTSPEAEKYSVLLQYPFEAGNEWHTVRDDRRVACTVAGSGLTVKVKAGEFEGCIKISERSPDVPGSVKYNYYAPDTGWVLTTTSASGGTEHRNTELLSYKISPE